MGEWKMKRRLITTLITTFSLNGSIAYATSYANENPNESKDSVDMSRKRYFKDGFRRVDQQYTTDLEPPSSTSTGGDKQDSKNDSFFNYEEWDSDSVS